MATQNKPVLGYRQCPDCGKRGTIHQAGGRRACLYQRCGCGCDQRNGRMVQSRFWHETEWLDGMKPETAPEAVYPEAEFRALLDAEPAVGQTDRASTGPEAEAVTDFDPEADREVAGQQTGEEQKPTGAMPWVLGGLAVAVAAVMGRV